MPAHQRPHPGYTLLELCLVLALLVVLAALAMPAVRSLLTSRRLENAADTIRAEWGKARARAIKTGRIYIFRFELNDNRYTVQPWFAEDDYLEASDNVQPLDRMAAPPSAAQANQTKQLPDGVMFISSETLQETRANEVEQGLSTSGIGASIARPVLFYPDGTTSTARILLADEGQDYIEINLRGLTGVSTVSDPLAANRQPR